MPKVSIIIANYNNVKYLTACLNSLSKQTFTDFEALIFDDKSTDNSIEVISRYELQDSRFKLIALPENKGVAYLRHIALSYCKGEYIAILDADDVSYPERLAQQTLYLDSHPQTVLISGLNALIDENGKLIKYRNGMPLTDIEHRWRLATGNCIVHSAIMFRKEPAIQVGGYNQDVKLSEDYDFYCRLTSAGKIESIPLLVCQLRLHRKSLTKKSKSEVQDNTLKIIIGNIHRMLNQEITVETAFGLYFYKRKPLSSSESFQSVFSLLTGLHEHFKQFALSDAETRILNRCYLRALFLLRKRNSKKKWFSALSASLDIKIRKMLALSGYYGLIDYNISRVMGEIKKQAIHAIKAMQYKRNEF